MFDAHKRYLVIMSHYVTYYTNNDGLKVCDNQSIIQCDWLLQSWSKKSHHAQIYY